MRYVALLRGINVGGHAKVSMTDLRELLTSLGHTEVATYIQSGNALFTSPRERPDELAAEIEHRIALDLGLQVKVMIRTRNELAAVIEGNPFPLQEEKAAGVHVCFLSGDPDPARVATIDRGQFEPEEFRVGDRAIYLWYPNGTGRAKLTMPFLERSLGVSGTTRNWNTVTKLLSLANG